MGEELLKANVVNKHKQEEVLIKANAVTEED